MFFFIFFSQVNVHISPGKWTLPRELKMDIFFDIHIFYVANLFRDKKGIKKSLFIDPLNIYKRKDMFVNVGVDW